MPPKSPALDTTDRVILGVLLALPLAVNLWKFLGRGYHFHELWRHLLLDVTVVALLMLVVALDPLEKPVVYGGLFLAFCAAFLQEHPPADPWEWFGSLVALALVGALFPLLHQLTGFVSLGLLLSYVFVIRLMLPEMSRAEALEVLARKRPAEVAAEALNTTIGYRRFFVGLEKLRYFLLQDEDYPARLAALEKLHGAVTADLTRQGISFLMWDELARLGGATPTRGEGAAASLTVAFRAGTVTGRLLERGANGVELPCTARVEPLSIRLVTLPDGSFRILELPERISATLVESP